MLYNLSAGVNSHSQSQTLSQTLNLGMNGPLLCDTGNIGIASLTKEGKLLAYLYTENTNT